MLRNGLYVFSNFIPFSQPIVKGTTISNATDIYKLWHPRFGHANATVIRHIMAHCNIVCFTKQMFCDSSHYWKTSSINFF